MRRICFLFILLLFPTGLFSFEIAPQFGVYNVGDDAHELLGITFSPPIEFNDFQVGGMVEVIWNANTYYHIGVHLRYDFLEDDEPIQPYTIGGTGILVMSGVDPYVSFSYGAGLRIPTNRFNFYIEERIDEVNIEGENRTHLATTIGLGFVF